MSAQAHSFETGLVLSGGAAKGYAHLGALAALYEAGYRFNIISGTSVGAIIGALLADGHTPAEIKNIFDEEKNFNLVKFKWSSPGLLSSAGLKKALKKHLRAQSFEELNLPLWVAATDFSMGKVRYINKGELILPILASCAIPMLFEPIRYDKRLFVDGGLTDNLPASPIHGQCNQLVGINVNPVGQIEKIEGWMQSMERILNIAIHNNVAKSIPMCDLYIEPALMESYHLFSLDKGEEMYEIGYAATKQALANKSNVFN
ncbi:MAG: patatin-like phospholipase family protein [Bacteroidia bacterium]